MLFFLLVEEDIKAELAAEGNQKKIWDKIIPGKWPLAWQHQADQAYTLAQVYIGRQQMLKLTLNQ